MYGSQVPGSAIWLSDPLAAALLISSQTLFGCPVFDSGFEDPRYRPLQPANVSVQGKKLNFPDSLTVKILDHVQLSAADVVPVEIAFHCSALLT
jgi:hypothetical protein